MFYKIVMHIFMMKYRLFLFLSTKASALFDENTKNLENYGIFTTTNTTRTRKQINVSKAVPKHGAQARVPV